MTRYSALLATIAICGCSNIRAPQRADAAYSLPADAMVLRVEVTAVEHTDYFHGGCDTDAGCIPFHFWFRYHAEVREVLVGPKGLAQVSFTLLQHAYYIDSYTRDCYVVLVPASPQLSKALGVPFRATDLLFQRNKHDRPEIRAIRAGNFTESAMQD